MNRLAWFLLAVLAAHSVYSMYYVWLLQRTSHACAQIAAEAADKQELIGAQRICSAAGVDTLPMLRRIFPQTPRKF